MSTRKLDDAARQIERFDLPDGSSPSSGSKSG